jgi:putative FmdB family regulatory protein
VPTYQYVCRECGGQLEAVQKFTDDPLTVHEACGGRLRKVFSPVGIVFKGSGFYRTDSRNGSAAAASASSSAASDSSGSSSSGGEKTSAGSAGSAGSEGSGKATPASSSPGSSASSSGSSGSSASSGEKVA